MQISYKKCLVVLVIFYSTKNFKMQIILYEFKFWLQKYIIMLIIEKFDKRSSR